MSGHSVSSVSCFRTSAQPKTWASSYKDTSPFGDSFALFTPLIGGHSEPGACCSPLGAFAVPLDEVSGLGSDKGLLNTSQQGFTFRQV